MLLLSRRMLVANEPAKPDAEAASTRKNRGAPLVAAGRVKLVFVPVAGSQAQSAAHEGAGSWAAA